jgi:hypothetical protein
LQTSASEKVEGASKWYTAAIRVEHSSSIQPHDLGYNGTELILVISKRPVSRLASLLVASGVTFTGYQRAQKVVLVVV